MTQCKQCFVDQRLCSKFLPDSKRLLDVRERRNGGPNSTLISEHHLHVLVQNHLPPHTLGVLRVNIHWLERAHTCACDSHVRVGSFSIPHSGGNRNWTRRVS